jgi:hypothetical protein
VRLTGAFSWSWLPAAENAVPLMSLPKAGWIPIIWVLAGGFIRILLEWQMRLTLVEIFRHAPGGSVVVIRKRGLRGTMWVQVGNGPVPGSRARQAELR